jgi:acyl carrier protein
MITTAHLPFTVQQIKDILIQLLRPIAPEANFTALDPDAGLQETLDIDSHDFLNFLIGLEEAVGVAVSEADYGRLVTLNDIVVYVLNH